jgi:hypothetical protein
MVAEQLWPLLTAMAAEVSSESIQGEESSAHIPPLVAVAVAVAIPPLVAVEVDVVLVVDPEAYHLPIASPPVLVVRNVVAMPSASVLLSYCYFEKLSPLADSDHSPLAE